MLFVHEGLILFLNLTRLKYLVVILLRKGFKEAARSAISNLMMWLLGGKLEVLKT